VADVNGEIVAASEIREWRALEPDLSDDQALKKIILEKLRLQDIARYTFYQVEDADILAALHGTALADTPQNRRAFRRKLLVQRFVRERFEALVSVSDTQVRTTLKESFPDLAEPDPAQPEWEKARKLLEARELERMIDEWDRKLAEKAKIRLIVPTENRPEV
jgi:transposase